MDWRWKLGNSMAPTKADGNQQSKASQRKNKYNTVMHITKKIVCTKLVLQDNGLCIKKKKKEKKKFQIINPWHSNIEWHTLQKTF